MATLAVATFAEPETYAQQLDAKVWARVQSFIGPITHCLTLLVHSRAQESECRDATWNHTVSA